MSSLFAFTLAAHVILGIIGVIASYAALLFLLKKTPSAFALRLSSFTAFLSYVLSWFAGGYYYVFYYGGNVKPAIKEGLYPWAHLVFMEAKEHIFLFLPFATLALFLVLYAKGDQLENDPTLKRSLILLSTVITVLATIITLSGILITGAGR